MANKVHMETFGPDGESHYWTGLAYHLQGDLETAKAHYQKSLAAAKNSTPFYAFNHIGILHQRLGLEREARAIWKRGLEGTQGALGFNSDQSFLWSYVIDAHVHLGELETARKFLNSMGEETRARFHSPFILTKKEVASTVLGMIKRGDNPGVKFITLAEVDGFQDLHTAPEYAEMLTEYYKLQKRLRDKYGQLDFLKKYEPKFSFPE